MNHSINDAAALVAKVIAIIEITSIPHLNSLHSALREKKLQSSKKARQMKSDSATGTTTSSP